jgi:hypothetical protein
MLDKLNASVKSVVRDTDEAAATVVEEEKEKTGCAPPAVGGLVDSVASYI